MLLQAPGPSEDTQDSQFSVATVPDPRDLRDVVWTSDMESEEEDDDCINTHYFKEDLRNTVMELERAGVGFNAASRILSMFSRDLHNAGLLSERLTITESKLRSQSSIHGKRKIQELSTKVVTGNVICQ